MTKSPNRSARWSDRVDPNSSNNLLNPSTDQPAAPEVLPTVRATLGQEAGPSRTAGRDSALSQRDWAVLTSLASYRYLTTGQLQRLHFFEHRSEGAASRICRRVLSRLHELRVIEHLERRIGGVRAGSASFVWRVGAAGDRLLREDAGAPRARRKEPSLRFLEHCLGVAECAVQLIENTRAGPRELLALQPEPASWRSYLGPHGVQETLKPDLAAVTADGEYEDWVFVEYDRATESLPTVIGKCIQYERYRRSGHEQEAHGVFPRVLWVVPHERRQDAMWQGLKHTKGLDRDLFRVVTEPNFISWITSND